MRRLRRAGGRHWRFLLAIGLGAAIWGGALGAGARAAPALLAGVDGFALIYLAMMIHLAQTQAAPDLRRYAADEDEGIALILTLALGVIALSLTGILRVLRGAEQGLGAPEVALALLAVPLGWAMIHTVAAFHYAHRYYAARPEGGLAFPGPEPPGPWDFIYFAFGIGMTAQVSDVMVTAPALRRVVTFHAVGAFFYNTVILALAVNAGLALAG